MPVPVIAWAAAVAGGLVGGLWLALRGGKRRTPGARAEDVAGVNGALDPGRTGRLDDADAGDEETFKRHELRERPEMTERPEMSGGEVAGPYGPLSNEAAPSAGGSTQVAATSTYISEGFSPGGVGRFVFTPTPESGSLADAFAPGGGGSYLFAPAALPGLPTINQLLTQPAPAPTAAPVTGGSGHVEA